VDSPGIRLDVYLSERAKLSRSRAQKLIQEGLARIDGRVAPKANQRLKAGQVVSVTVPEPETVKVEAEPIPLAVVYEDQDLLVVNKPQGMVVHPAAGNWRGTLVNALLNHCSDLSGINGEIRPGIVHRLDKDTSGLLVVAKNDDAHRGLAEQLKEHKLSRTYWAIIYGHLRPPVGTVDAPIGRHPVERKKMAVTPGRGRRAVTHYRVLEEFKGYSLVELTLETGRTHQIRVHLAYLGHAIAGDPLYGPAGQVLGLKGQALHAINLKFIHPTTGEELNCKAELPPWFKEALETLRGQV